MQRLCVKMLGFAGRPGVTGPIPQRRLPPLSNPPEEMTHEDVLRVRLEVLRQEHRDLDAAIAALEAGIRPDPLAVKRLKKQKLSLKDRIARIEDELTPDIIA